MGVKTTIAWTDSTWSPLRVLVREDAAKIAEEKGYRSLVQIAEKNAGHIGHHCEKVSEECDECYSMHMQARCLPYNGTGLPFDRRSRDLVEPFVDERELLKPLSWREPKKIFSQNQDDVFGEWYSDEMIDRVFAVAVLCPQHTFQILTKRPGRMKSYFCSQRAMDRISEIARSYARSERLKARANCAEFPLPNCWLGVSAGTQKAADERLPILEKIPAAVRFVSYEPALEAVDFRPYLGWVDWIIVGGESQSGARPFDIDWAAKTVRDCEEAGVACFVKQLGALPMTSGMGLASFCRFPNNPTQQYDPKTNRWRVFLQDKKHGADPQEWPSGLQVQNFPNEVR